MAENQSNKEEDKFEFTAEGEARAYTPRYQARVRALQHAWNTGARHVFAHSYWAWAGGPAYGTTQNLTGTAWATEGWITGHYGVRVVKTGANRRALNQDDPAGP